VAHRGSCNGAYARGAAEREECVDVAECRHRCIAGIDGCWDDEQPAVSRRVPVRLDWLIEPTRILRGVATSAELFRWAAVLDLIGYFLATAVLGYVLWRQLRPRNPVIADLSTMAAVGYALAGGVGAAVLAMPHRP
jgi:hypothetical protein